MAVDATVPFEVVADQIGEDAWCAPATGREAVVERTVEVGGRSFHVVATGSVEVVDGRLVVEPTTIDLGGPSFLAGLIGSVVRGLVTIEHEVEGLPDGLVLQEVVVQDDGFRATLSGDDVRIVLTASPTHAETRSGVVRHQRAVLSVGPAGVRADVGVRGPRTRRPRGAASARRPARTRPSSPCAGTARAGRSRRARRAG